MIRINLLQGRLDARGGIESIVAPSRPTAFVSRLELLLGGVFLLLGCLILFSQLKNTESKVEDGSLAAGSQGSAVSLSGGAALDGRQVGAGANTEAEVVPSVANASISGQPGDGGGPSSSVSSAKSDASSAPAAEAQAAVLGVTPEKGQESNLAAEPGLLSKLFVTAQEDSVRIFVATGNQPEYKIFRLNSPNRVVVDLPGLVLSLPSGQYEQSVSHPQIRRVRVAQYQLDPPIARLVLDVSSFPDLEYLPQFNGLYIRASEKKTE